MDITKNIQTLLLASLFGLSAAQAQTILEATRQQVTSPDGKYQFETYQKQMPKGGKRLYYTLNYDGKEVVKESELGMMLENQLFESALGIPNEDIDDWSENLNLMEMVVSQQDTVWIPPYGERNRVRDHYNQIELQFKKGTEGGLDAEEFDKRLCYRMHFIVRAYNEGVAFRYFFPETDNGLFLHTMGERTQFVMPEGTMAYYEKWAQGPYHYLPLKDWEAESERPLTMRLANGLTVALGEAQMTDYARTKFRLAKENVLQTSVYSSVDVISPYATPWRTIMVGERAIDLIANNDLILNLNPPCQIKDTSWIKPGKVIRVADLRQAAALKCVDFAAEHDLRYIHLDARWYGPEMKVATDASKPDASKDFDMPALTAYAASKGIGVWVYVNQRALYNQLDSILPVYKKWGIKGLKFGFVQVGNQFWTNWLHDAVKKCAEYQLMVDIHDEYRPTGFSRTYPNLLTQEGIRGNEEMPDATHNTILPFTRFLCGAGDYTICYYNNRIKTTHAHQLAMAVVYYSPLQFLYWYDQPSAYQGEPEIEFFDKVKTVWDDTMVIDGEIGEFVTVARRADNQWFIGTLGNKESRSVTTPLSFLNKNEKYVAHIYTDDDAVQTRTHVKVTRLIVDSKSVLRFQLKASGGCAIRLEPATKDDQKQYKRYKGETLG